MPEKAGPPKALIFDVFGTLVDWRGSVAREVSAAFANKPVTVDADAFADAWRGEYDPAMARVRDGQRGYVPLDVLHRENLDHVLDRLGLGEWLDGAERVALNHAWEKLDPWPDVVAGLDAARANALVAPCSNGSIALMARLARHGGLHWDAIAGAEVARAYKPDPAVYLSSCAALGLEPDKVMMVAAHNNDLVAARACGLQTGFIPRPTEHGPGQISDLMAEADWTVEAESLPALVALVFSRA